MTRIARLRAELQIRDEPALLVFENMNDPDHLAEYLPATGPTQIIITSTQLAVRSLGHMVPVDVFTPAEAVTFLREATGLDDDAGAGELAWELGWLPLALAHAAAVIRARAITYPDCLTLIRDYPLPRYLVNQPGQQYRRGTAEAILLSLCTTLVLTPTLASPASSVFSRCSHQMGSRANCSPCSLTAMPRRWATSYSD